MLSNGLYLYTIFSESPQSMKSLNPKSVQWSSFKPTNFFSLHICLRGFICVIFPSFFYHRLFHFPRSRKQDSQTLPLSVRSLHLLKPSFLLNNSPSVTFPISLPLPLLSMQVCRSHHWQMGMATVDGTSSGSR